MQSLTDLFAEKKIRAIFDSRTGKWWFSVVDVIAAINGCDIKTAKNYWKWLKRKLENEKIGEVSVTNLTDFPTADNKKHFSDVTDIKGLLQLIMAYPSPKAVPLRLWLADVLAENPLIVGQFAEIGEKSAKLKKPVSLRKIAVHDIPEE